MFWNKELESQAPICPLKMLSAPRKSSQDFRFLNSATPKEKLTTWNPKTDVKMGPLQSPGVSFRFVYLKNFFSSQESVLPNHLAKL